MKRRDSLLNSNLFVRLISVLLGFVVWIIVNSSASGDITTTGLTNTAMTLKNVPVIVSTDENMVAVHVRPSTVHVNVTGTVLGVATVQVESSSIRLKAMANHLSAGVHMVPVTIVGSPTTGVNYTPQVTSVAVDLEPRATVSMQPRLRILGHPALGYKVAKGDLKLAPVTVTGPAALVHLVSAVVASVSVQGSVQNVTQGVTYTPVDVRGTRVRGITCSPSTSTVTVPILQQTRFVPLVATTVGQPAKNFIVSQVVITPNRVAVSGPSAMLQKLATITLPAIHIGRWSSSQSLQVPIPIPFEGGRLSIPVARVAITVVPSLQTTLQGIPVTFVGQQNGIAYTSTGSSTIDLVVSGPAQTVYALSPQDVQAYVDVSTLKPGHKARLAIGVALPPTFITVQLSPGSMEVAASLHR